MWPLVFFATAASVLAAGADPDHSTITASAATPTVDDPSPTVTVQAKDSADADLTTGGDLVTLSDSIDGAPGVDLPASDNGDGTYTATVTDTHPRTHVISGTINDAPITSGDASIAFKVGAANAANSTITAASSSPSVDVGSTTVTVQAKDQFDNALSSDADSVTLSDSLDGTLTVTNNHNGSYSATVGDHHTRSHTISGTINSTPITTGNATVDFTPGVLHHFTVSAPASTTAGMPFSVTVTANDQYDNTKTDYLGTITFSSSDGPPFPAGLPAAYPFVAGDGGIHTFTNLVTLFNTISQTVTVTDSGKTGIPIPTIAVTPAALDHFSVSAPASTVAGSPFSVTVTAYDQYNNVKTDYTGTITFSSSDGTPFPATYPGPYTFVAGDGGIHTFTNAVTLFNTTSQTVTVTDSGKTGVATVGVTPAALDHFSVSAPASTVAGSPFSVTVTAYDQYNNVKTDYTGTITFSSSDGTPFPATYPGPYTFVAGDGGIHTFTNAVTLFNTTSQTVTVTDSGKTGVATVGVTPAAVHHYTIPSVSDVTAGVTIPTRVISAFDQYNNAATNYNWSTAQVTTGLATDLEGSPTGCGIGNASPCSVPAGTFTAIGSTGTANLADLRATRPKAGGRSQSRTALLPARRAATPSP